MSEVFVTGGSGFIGRRLIRRLVGDGHTVRALARSDRSADTVCGAGAEPAPGDIADESSLRAGADGCELAFHAAAEVGEWGPWQDFRRANVEGTERVLAACQAVGVRRFVHVGTEAALLAGEPLVNVDETSPLRPDSPVPYAATKALAEQAVREANGDGFETVVVRPRFVWGPGDASILPSLVSAIRAGRFAWIGGGRHRTSTTHVDNAVEGLVLAAMRGHPGGVYFVTDGEPVVFRDFVTRLVGTEGVEPPGRNIPLPLARALAAGCEAVWRLLRLKSAPPLTRMAVWISALETTIDISRAREELGYTPVVSIEDGLEELRLAHERAETGAEPPRPLA
jgi:nucleoside-diphosphate-sugar epimerase